MEIGANASIHNRFDIYVRDVKTNEIIQKAQAENIVLNRIYTNLCNFSAYFNNICFGTGTGTPAVGDTTLFTYLGYKAATTYSLVRSSPTSTWIRSIRLAEDEYNGSTLTEVGISDTYPQINTHAMIKDSEGNTITIPKTNTKIIDIYATVYATVYDVDTGLYFDGTGLRDYLTGGSIGSGSISLGYVSDDDECTQNSTRTSDTSTKSVTATYKFLVNDFNKEVRYIQCNSVGLRCVMPRTGVFDGYPKTSVVLGTGDGTNTIFTIPQTKISNLVVYIDGTSTTAYTINNLGKIVFNTAVANGSVVTADYTCLYIPKDINHDLTVAMKIVYGGSQPSPVVSPPDYSGVPGNSAVIAGSSTYGFFGEVASTSLISGDDLCSMINLTAGTSQNSTGGWLKFVKDSRILFVSKKTIRYNLCWNDINAVGAAFGTIITLNGIKYAVRLLSSAEWDALIYPVHVNYSTWATYSDADLNITGNGGYTWTSTPSGSGRVYRGYTSVSYLGHNIPSVVYSGYGFRPVLEIL